MRSGNEERFLECLGMFRTEALLLYFAELDHILGAVGVLADDARMVYGCNPGDNLVVIVGQRYAFALRNGADELFGFMTPDRVRVENADIFRFEGRNAPFFVWSAQHDAVVRNRPRVIQAISSELERTRKSGFRKGSNRYFEQAVFNKEYRSRALAERMSLEQAGADEALGAGFQVNAAQRRQVESAAIQWVRKKYERDGYTVRSVESERIGYDLHIVKGRKELHVEVKGVAGSERHVILTHQEQERCKSDRCFILAVVSSALTTPTLFELSGAEVLVQYQFKPLAFNARFAGVAAIK